MKDILYILQNRLLLTSSDVPNVLCLQASISDITSDPEMPWVRSTRRVPLGTKKYVSIRTSDTCNYQNPIPRSACYKIHIFLVYIAKHAQTDKRRKMEEMLETGFYWLMKMNILFGLLKRNLPLTGCVRSLN